MASVHQNPALEDGRLRYGDEILQVRASGCKCKKVNRSRPWGLLVTLLALCLFQVNDQSLVGMSHQKAAQIIRSVSTEGRFVVRRGSQVKRLINFNWKLESMLVSQRYIKEWNTNNGKNTFITFKSLCWVGTRNAMKN